MALGQVATAHLDVIEGLTTHFADADREVRRSAVGASVMLAQRVRSQSFLVAVNRLEQLARSGVSEDRALYRSAATALRASLPARRSWPRKSAAESDMLPRPAEPPAVDAHDLPRVVEDPNTDR
jgi:hypothetical protein